MAKRVEDFIYNMLINVFNAEDTAGLAIEAILRTNGFDPGPKAEKIEDAAQWTRAKIIERAGTINSNKGAQGDFDD